MKTTDASSRVWKKVRHREEEPLDEGVNGEMMDAEGLQPLLFRDAVLNAKRDSPRLEDE